MTPSDTTNPPLTVAVAVFGAANLDIAASARTTLAPGDSTPGHITSTAGGVGRNIAENLARLHYKTFLISAVGDDLHGQFLLGHTRRAGVDISACSVLSSINTGLYLSLNQPDGALLAAINDMAAIDLLTPSEIARHRLGGGLQFKRSLHCMADAQQGWKAGICRWRVQQQMPKSSAPSGSRPHAENQPA